MATCRSIAAAPVASTSVAPLLDPLADIDPADLARFVRNLAEAAASWHRRRQAVPVPLHSADRADLSKVA